VPKEVIVGELAEAVLHALLDAARVICDLGVRRIRPQALSLEGGLLREHPDLQARHPLLHDE
jgi:hypothetical protein